MKNFVLHFIAILLYNAGTKIGTTPGMAASWCPQSPWLRYLCRSTAGTEKGEKNFLKKFKKMLDKWCRNPYTSGAPFEMQTTWRYSSVG